MSATRREGGQGEKKTCGHGGEGSSKGGRPLLVKSRSTELFSGENVI